MEQCWWKEWYVSPEQGIRHRAHNSCAPPPCTIDVNNLFTFYSFFVHLSTLSNQLRFESHFHTFVYRKADTYTVTVFLPIRFFIWEEIDTSESIPSPTQLYPRWRCVLFQNSNSIDFLEDKASYIIIWLLIKYLESSCFTKRLDSRHWQSRNHFWRM